MPPLQTYGIRSFHAVFFRLIGERDGLANDEEVVDFSDIVAGLIVDGPPRR